MVDFGEFKQFQRVNNYDILLTTHVVSVFIYMHGSSDQSYFICNTHVRGCMISRIRAISSAIYTYEDSSDVSCYPSRRILCWHEISAHGFIPHLHGMLPEETMDNKNPLLISPRYGLRRRSSAEGPNYKESIINIQVD